MEGLAQQMTGAPVPQQQQGMPSIEQIIELLMQGMDPEELVSQGIPPELIMQAIEVLEQQLAAQEGQAPQQAAPQGMPQQPQGLAQNLMG